MLASISDISRHFKIQEAILGGRQGDDAGSVEGRGKHFRALVSERM